MDSRNTIECYSKSINRILNASHKVNKNCKVRFDEKHLSVEFQNKKERNCLLRSVAPLSRKMSDSLTNNERTICDELSNDSNRNTTAYDYISYCGSVPDHPSSFLIVSKRNCGLVCHIFQLSSPKMAKKFKNKVCAFIEQAFSEFKLKTYHNYSFSNEY